MSSSIKPMSALMSALRRAGRPYLTSTTVTTRQPVTGSHVLRIHGYKQVMKAVPNGTAVESSMFDVGGHRWRVRCYPNGHAKEDDGSTSLFVELKHTSDANVGDVAATLKCSVLDQAGKPSCTRTTAMRCFSRTDWGWKDFLKNDDLVDGEHLVDDCLTVLCDVTLDHGLRVDAAVAEDDEVPPFDFDLRGQTDVTIHVGGETLAAHRRVLEARSPVFKADLENNATGELRVEDMDAEVFKTLLQFMYTEGALPAAGTNQLHLHNAAAPSMADITQQLETEATMAERLLVAADRYGLEKLKLACEEALRPRLDMGSVAVMLALAERHRCAVLREACMELLSCPSNLESFMAADGFQQLKTSCPSAALELVLKRMP